MTFKYEALEQNSIILSKAMNTVIKILVKPAADLILTSCDV